MNRNFKKNIRIWRDPDLFLLPLLLLPLVIMVLLSPPLPAADATQTMEVSSDVTVIPPVKDTVYSGFIRFHIKANSDSEEDQALKLQVRNHVLAKVQNHLMDSISREISAVQDGTGLTEERKLELTRSWIHENMDTIEKWAEETVHAEGFSYTVSATLGVTWIPEREYDGIYFPPGNYEALTLHIGEGAGQNWWCVLFPPLCLIDCSDELGQARFEIAGKDRIVLKSRIKELIYGQSRPAQRTK